MQYLYHGTSAAYIPYIYNNGLTGKYPKELLNIFEKYYDYKSTPKSIYVSMFLDRQKKIKEDNTTINLSLTNNIEIAKEFANSERSNGEGPGIIIHRISEQYNEKKFEELDTFKKLEILNLLKIFGENPYKFKIPGIILAFKKTDLIRIVELNEDNEFKKNAIIKIINNNEIRYEINFAYQIPPNIIYIYTSETYIKLLSEEGYNYITELHLPEGDIIEIALPESLELSEDMLNKEIEIPASEIINYKILATGESDIYSNYYFDYNKYENGNYFYTITKKEKFKNKYIKYKLKYLQLKKN